MKSLLRYTRLHEIVGDIIRVRARDVFLGELAEVRNSDGRMSHARVIEIDRDIVSLLLFAGTKGISTEAQVTFLGRNFEVVASDNALGRVFNGSAEIIDQGPPLDGEDHMEIGGPVVNPVLRQMPDKMIRTDIPMIDLFNCLVESQKIPIFSVAGEPYNALLARVGFQADADVVIFGGLGLIFDDFHFFRSQFEKHGVSHRTIMFVNQASDPIVERLLVPDMALAVAERFAVEQGKRVLVLLTDMTAYADALKEVGIAMERIPANRGYTGDLYTELAQRYEKACNFQGAGSITLLTVTTMPGNDVTHPVPDNTGYITEGQFYLHDGVLDPFGSLSRLKQHVIGKVTREDHGPIMNTMVRFYSGAVEAERKRSMAFDLSPIDEKLLRFGGLFRERFMDVDVALPIEAALDLAWRTLAECFDSDELLMKQQLIDQYFPCDLMAKVPQSKQALTQLRRQRDLYVRVLPSLDLKRRKLTAEVNEARERLATGERELEALLERAAAALPMLANPELDLLGLVEIQGIECGEENMVGVRLPVLDHAKVRIQPYSLLGKPHWVDPLAEVEVEVANRLVALAVDRRRLELLERALRRVSQRVNLFEKVLIPETQSTIKRIQIHLADAERAAVVRSKIFKSKLQTSQDRVA